MRSTVPATGERRETESGRLPRLANPGLPSRRDMRRPVIELLAVAQDPAPAPNG